MKSICFFKSRSRAISALAVFLLLAAFHFAMAQTSTRVLGSLSAVNGNALTVKAGSGVETSFTVTEKTVLKRIEPGQKDLTKAVEMTLSELAKGDRVLVALDGSTTPATALRIIAIKAEDLAAKQQRENEEWQKNGVGGLVKLVDAASGTLQIVSGFGSTQKTITVHATSATTIKRYAPDSVDYEKAMDAPLSAIHAGDQLRARGTKNADGTEIAAVEVVSGTFLNLSGKLDAVDAAAKTISFKDLATKKSVTVHVGDGAQMRAVPEQMATMIAMRLNQGGSRAAGPPQTARLGQGGERWNGGNGSGGTGGMQMLLNRAPEVHLNELKKGDAVMLVASGEDGHINLITLLSGVEPLLEAPASKDMLSNWSMGSGNGGDMGGVQ